MCRRIIQRHRAERGLIPSYLSRFCTLGAIWMRPLMHACHRLRLTIRQAYPLVPPVPTTETSHLQFHAGGKQVAVEHNASGVLLQNER